MLTLDAVMPSYALHVLKITPVAADPCLTIQAMIQPDSTAYLLVLVMDIADDHDADHSYFMGAAVDDAHWQSLPKSLKPSSLGHPPGR